MNCLVVQTSGKDGEMFKVLSNEKIFKLPDDLENAKIYDSDYKLEDDEWFHIQNFSEMEFCIEFLKKEFISAEYKQIGKLDDISKLLFLCSYQEEVYYFQRLTQSLTVNKKWFKISGEPVLEKKSPIIVINEIPDAIYVKSQDVLYFKKLSALTSVFKGIIELYKEATQQETESFLKSEFISLKEGYNATKVKTANRRRIAMAMETFKEFNNKDKADIFSYIKGYCTELDFDEKGGKFIINNEKELKHLLWGIEQRYYTTPIGKEKMVANSVSKVGQ